MRKYQFNKSEKLLRFYREPSYQSYGQCFALICLGFSAACSSHDSMLWKSLYLVGGALMASYFLQDWQEVIFNKNEELMRFRRFSIRDMLIDLMYGTNKGQNSIVIELDKIFFVRLHSLRVPLYGVGYQLVIALKDGNSLAFSDGLDFKTDPSDYQVAVKLINEFLQIPSFEELSAQMHADSSLDASTSKSNAKDEASAFEASEEATLPKRKRPETAMEFAAEPHEYEERAASCADAGDADALREPSCRKRTVASGGAGGAVLR